MLFHPGPAKLDCRDCVKFVTDLDRGEVMTYRKTVDGQRVEVPQERPPGALPPCQRCPKESPDRASNHELSDKNWQAVGHYQRAKAVGLTDEERRDPIVRHNFSIIDQAFRTFEAQQSATINAAEIAKLAMGRGA